MTTRLRGSAGLKGSALSRTLGFDSGQPAADQPAEAATCCHPDYHDLGVHAPTERGPS